MLLTGDSLTHLVSRVWRSQTKGEATYTVGPFDTHPLKSRFSLVDRRDPCDSQVRVFRADSPSRGMGKFYWDTGCKVEKVKQYWSRMRWGVEVLHRGPESGSSVAAQHPVLTSLVLRLEAMTEGGNLAGSVGARLFVWQHGASTTKPRSRGGVSLCINRESEI